MGRHYNRTKKDIGGTRKASPEKQDLQAEKTSYRLAKAYGVGHDTIEKAGKFAAAVETLKAVDPEIGYHAGPDGWRPRLRDLAESCGIRASRLRRTPGAIRRTRPPWRPVRPRVRP